MKWKAGGRRLINVEECVAASDIRSIHHYLVNSEEALLKAVVKERKIGDGVIEGKKEYNRRIKSGNEEFVIRIKLHGQFEEKTMDIKSEKRRI